MGRSCQTLQRSLSFSPVDPWLFVVGTETGTSEHVVSLGGAAGAAGADDGSLCFFLSLCTECC